jgi:hypothetical protein
MKVVAGNVYFVAVDGVNGASGLVKLSYSFAQGPVISEQPRSIEAKVGETATFLVQTSNPLSGVGANEVPELYQWTKNGIKLAGETTRALAIASVRLEDAGDYELQVSNFAGTSKSAIARLSVIVPLEITVQPVDLAAKVGDTARFNVVASGSDPITYQWRLNAVDVPGATSETLEIPNIQAIQGGAYTVVVKNPAGTLSSSPAVLSLSQAPVISEQPSRGVSTIGGSVTFAVTATGSAPLEYQWRFNGVNIPGETAPVLRLSNVDPSYVGEYVVVVSNSAGSVASLGANLEVRVPLTLLEVPQSQAVTAGSTALFTVLAGGSGPFGYQWSHNGSDLPGETNPVLTLPNVQSANEGTYKVVVTGGTEFLESPPATLKVGTVPIITEQPQSVVAFVGQELSFQVAADAGGTLLYQWSHNSEPLPGATNSVLTLSSIRLDMAGTYSVSIRNEAGAVLSDLAVLTVREIVTDARFGANGFTFRLNVPDGSTARVQVTTDMTLWNDLVTGITGVVDFEDPEANSVEQRFYRVLLE